MKTPEQKRGCIAELLGYDTSLADVCHCGDHMDRSAHEGHSATPVLVISNYTGSLDACAEFEATLTKLEHENYCALLSEMCESDFHKQHHLYTFRDRACAYAAQRCDAFLLVKGETL